MINPSINVMNLHVMHLQDASSMFLAQKGSNFTLCEIWDSPAYGLRHAMMQVVCSLSFQADWHTACNMACAKPCALHSLDRSAHGLQHGMCQAVCSLPFKADWHPACIRPCAKPCVIFQMPKTCILKCNTCTKHPQP